MTNDIPFDGGQGGSLSLSVNPTEVLGATPSDLQMMSSALIINDAFPNLNKHEGTALILDINNLYRRAADNNWTIDYSKLRNILMSRCDLRHFSAFSAIDRSDPGGQRWVSYMQRNGYFVSTKSLKRYTSRTSGELVAKGNMDIEITIAALSLSEAFAHVIIGTCDGDFVPLVEKLKEGHFRRVSVLGITNDNRTGMSDELVKTADNFYDLTQIKEFVSYRERR